MKNQKILSVITLVVMLLLTVLPAGAQDYAPTPEAELPPPPGEELPPANVDPNAGGTVDVPDTGDLVIVWDDPNDVGGVDGITDVAVTVPAAALPAVPTGYTFQYIPRNPADIPAAAEIATPLATFQLNVLDASGAPVTGIDFDPPIQICALFTMEEATALGGEANITVAFYNAATGDWQSLGTTIVASATATNQGKACATVSHLTWFALTSKFTPLGLPVTGDAPAAPSLAPVWLSLAAAAVLVLGFATWRRVRAG